MAVRLGGISIFYIDHRDSQWWANSGQNSVWRPLDLALAAVPPERAMPPMRYFSGQHSHQRPLLQERLPVLRGPHQCNGGVEVHRR